MDNKNEKEREMLLKEIKRLLESASLGELRAMYGFLRP